MKYSYRPGTKTDFKQLQQLGLISYGKFKTILTEENWKKMESVHLDDKTYLDLLDTAKCFVCEKENEIIGMAFLIPHGNPRDFFKTDWSYIRLVGVHPEHEGNGIGKTLTKMCVDHAKQSGENIIALHTSEFQHAARHIYESIGFKIQQELGNIYGMKYFLYTLPLNKNMNNITYHKANLNDIQILNDYRLKFAIELTGEHPQESIDALKEQFGNYFTKAINENSCIAYIAKEDDVIAGIGAMIIREQPGSFKNPSGKFGYVMSMYTIPAYRRKGICTNILNSLINDAKQSGITAFELHATKEGEYVYKQNGFEIHIEPTYRKYI